MIYVISVNTSDQGVDHGVAVRCFIYSDARQIETDIWHNRRCKL